MITSGTFSEELPNSKFTSVELLNFSAPVYDQGYSGQRTVKIVGASGQEFTLLLTPKSEIPEFSGYSGSNTYCITFASGVYSPEASKMIDSLNSGEEIDIKFDVQDGKYSLSIDDEIVTGGDFSGGVKSLEISGSGISFDKKIYIDQPNIAVEISGSGGLESRESLFTIVPDVNLDIKLSGIEIEITDDNGTNQKINIDSGVMISGSPIEIKKNSASGISGLLEGIWVSSFGSRTKITRE